MTLVLPQKSAASLCEFCVFASLALESKWPSPACLHGCRAYLRAAFFSSLAGSKQLSWVSSVLELTTHRKAGGIVKKSLKMIWSTAKPQNVQTVLIHGWNQEIFCMHRCRLAFSKGAQRSGCLCGCHKLDAQMICVSSTSTRFCFSLSCNNNFGNLAPVKWQVIMRQLAYFRVISFAEWALWTEKENQKYFPISIDLKTLQSRLKLSCLKIKVFFQSFLFKAFQIFFFFFCLLWRSFFLIGRLLLNETYIIGTTCCE